MCVFYVIYLNIFCFSFIRLNLENGVEKGGSFAAYYKGNFCNIQNVDELI